jgi:mannose-binding lectin 2
MARLLRCGGAQSLVALVALLAAIGLSRADGTQGHLLDEEQWQRRKILTEFSLGPAPYTHQAQSGYELFADAYFRPDHIEVTKAEQHQTGAVWSKKRLEPTQSWQVDMTFRVGMWERDLFGDGFAFWYALDRGVGGVAMGGPTRFTGLAVFFDTYK